MFNIENFNEIEENIRTYSKTLKKFFFIQIGACDGEIVDEFNPLFKTMNWKGILIEPRKKYFDKLINTYKDKPYTFENIAISNKNGTQDLYNFKYEEIYANWQEACATLIPESHNELSKVKKDNLEVETVKCCTWKTLVEKNKINEIHLLIIDTEGFDFEIIKQIDFHSLKPHIIFYEFAHLGENIHKSAKYLIDIGYYIYKYRHNFLCYHKDFFNLKS